MSPFYMSLSIALAWLIFRVKVMRELDIFRQCLVVLGLKVETPHTLLNTFSALA